MPNFKWYGKGLVNQLNGNIDINTDTFKVMLWASGYAPNQDTHEFRSDVTNELAAAGGYTAGGLTLTGVTVVYDAATNEARILWDDALWDPATFTGRGASIYKSRGGAASADELVAFLDNVTDYVVSAAPFKLDFTTSVLKITATA